ncbi:MAG: type II secretion system protein [Edaphobacter sp.]|uniref:type II secretion system protein n=1 Tax=Edaphobacter sp. TaxID=1934404 RepID=UPI002387523C|nr:type II secretion system protein [Edaphobacter sp.]MDE1177396.1 type II secretion system protein [Edaphobacter sp.]
MSSRSVAEGSAPLPAHGDRRTRESGFTLIELMIVMIIISVLAAIAVPMYVQSVRNAKEAVLKEDLRTMRAAIDAYTIDKQKAPQSLDDLVQQGYLKSMPKDPMTSRADTWVPSQDDAFMTLDQTESGITDVHSGAQGVAGDGSSYSTW